MSSTFISRVLSAVPGAMIESRRRRLRESVHSARGRSSRDRLVADRQAPADRAGHGFPSRPGGPGAGRHRDARCCGASAPTPPPPSGAGLSGEPALDGLRVNERRASALLAAWCEAAAEVAGPHAGRVREPSSPSWSSFRNALRTTNTGRRKTRCAARGSSSGDGRDRSHLRRVPRRRRRFGPHRRRQSRRRLPSSASPATR